MSVMLTTERQLINCKAVNETHRALLPGVVRLLGPRHKIVNDKKVVGGT